MIDVLDLTDKAAVIAGLAPRKTFVDIGGLWGLTNEMVTPALRAGAASATMVDIVPQGHSLWLDFQSKLAEQGDRGVACLTADACAPELIERIGRYDICHSSGIIYHVHSPYNYLINLHAVTREYLVLTSMVVPDVISGDDGEIDLSGGRFLSTHQLDEKQQLIIGSYLKRMGLPYETIMQDAQKLMYGPGKPNFGPWWWFFTAETIRRMLSAVGFRLVNDAETWGGRAHNFLCAPLVDNEIESQTSDSRVSVASTVATETTRPLSHIIEARENDESLAAPAINLAYGEALIDTGVWAEGIEYECQFWAQWFQTAGREWPEEFIQRMKPDTPMDERMEMVIGRLAAGDGIRILDVGAGPSTSLGTQSKQGRIYLKAVDPLASLYDEIISASGYSPPVRTGFAPAEALYLALDGSERFDIVHCRNALDHSINPLVGILNMLSVTKPGGLVYLRHIPNEAERENYCGFHQFNLEVDSDDFLIWNKRWRWNVGEWLHEIAKVEVIPGGLGAEVLLRPTTEIAGSLPYDISKAALDAIRREVAKGAKSLSSLLNARASARI
ncbi:bifunctional 2-polyprenyl-6-hydroxyphenol methylase/3-demethylubiquinol 3-O-methyltransferase UbiG [Methylocystis sp. ATCC 49242]|uniref:class I SAM-dependent methyltransferase n=1 Tax=Methylocystis sp. ATCC 49242 TaxID=622637 RepID=UPI0001F875C2|nr:hypothetical protein [Methylocystis sp. ATCC 49242]